MWLDLCYLVELSCQDLELRERIDLDIADPSQVSPPSSLLPRLLSTMHRSFLPSHAV